MTYFRTYTEIDLGAIRRNAEVLKAYTGGRLIAVVKADAYGHGIVRVVEALGAVADMFAVATVAEGVELRASGVSAPILVLFSSSRADAELVVERGLIPAVGDWDFAHRLNEVALSGVKVHVNINTGMNRGGVRYSGALAFLHGLRKLCRISVAGVFTHFATAGEPDRSYVSVQLGRFSSVVAEVSQADVLVHAANSAAVLAVPESYFGAVRPGLSLYGIYPSGERPVVLEPALAWKSRIGWVGSLSAGEGVSYGLTYRAARPTRVAMVEVGYGDGYPCALAGVGEVLVAGARRLVIGAVCMDVIVVRLEAEDKVSIGDEVVLIGRQGSAEISVDEMAGRAGTIPYEILTRIGRRVGRVFKEEVPLPQPPPCHGGGNSSSP